MQRHRRAEHAVLRAAVSIRPPRCKTLKMALLWSLLLSHQGQASDKRNCAAPQAAVDSTYSPGQVWSYKTRPGESSSTVTILRVETTPKIGTIIHVRIDGVRFKNCTGGSAPNTIEHAPFAKSALDKSVGHKLSTVTRLPDFEAGYGDWLAHCGGVYTITVAEMVGADDATFNAGLGCKT
jgi:hypothetical protein